MIRPSRDEAKQAVKTLLAYVCDDPNRPGLEDTPERVIKGYEQDWCAGYQQDPAEILKQFEDGAEYYSGIVFEGSIPLTSLCEHHLCSIFGYAHFGYIPDKRIVGLSKIPRLINVFAKRLMVQERMSSLIVDSFMQHVPCKGCGLVLRLRHMCMESRGVRLHNSVTTTSDLRGIFLNDEGTKAEFLGLVRNEGK
jgi:GTP cyclohydrolase I